MQGMWLTCHFMCLNRTGAERPGKCHAALSVLVHILIVSTPTSWKLDSGGGLVYVVKIPYF